MNIYLGGCLTGLGDTNRIRGHSSSDSLFIFNSLYQARLQRNLTLDGDTRESSARLPGFDWICDFKA